MIQTPLALATLIATVTALAFWLDYRFPALGKVGASMLAIIFGAILSNTGLVPASSPVYDAVEGPVTSVSIAWLLLSVNLRDLRKAGPRMTGAFAVAVIGTMLGAFVAAMLYQERFADDTWRIAGALTGTYSGGSVNFVSVGRELGLTGALFAGLNAADAVMTGIWLGACLMLPMWLGRFFAPVRSDAADAGGTGPEERPEGTAAEDADAASDERAAHHPYFVTEKLSAIGIANLFAAGLVLVFASEWLGESFPGWLRETVPIIPWVPNIPGIVWLTTLALILGHSRFYRDAPGAMQLGSIGLHFFFVLIGIMSRFSEIAAVGSEVFFFTLVVVAIHGAFVFGAGRLLRLDIGTVAVASQAAVGGPSSALAVAISREWRHLVLPGVVMGLFGYAVGTYLGLGVGYLLR